MKRIFYLSTCDTCKRLMKAWNLPKSVYQQDIKKEAIQADQLEHMYKLAGSYEALFSKRARLYKERNLAQADLSESDLRDLILEHYSFLKRPVLIWEDQIFIGNSKQNAEAVSAIINAQEE
ncbi:arsenate reductase family protein [Croceimicrobium sp.]|uniref:arsenate reductase family protein n=1 Tax=Croceimicrobium sp. TaxID=2828340 RepID=UPI003BA8A5AA